MIEFNPRKFKFKAWNKEARLLLKLSSIECVKGELFKRDHILLQYTGHHDKQEEEIYEMDIVLIRSEKFVITWDEESNGWYLTNLESQEKVKPFTQEVSENAVRLCSYFESEQSH